MLKYTIMANENVLSTSEFLKTMRRTPLGNNTSLTLGEASLLSNLGINPLSANSAPEELVQEEKKSQTIWDDIFGTIDNIANSFGRGFTGMFEGIIDFGASLVGNVIDWAGGDSSGIEDFIEVDMSANLANFTETFANLTPWGIAKMIGNAVEYGDEYWKDFGEAWSSLGLGLWSADGDISDKEFEEWREKYAYGHDLLEENTGWFGQGVLAISEGAGQLVGMYLTAGLGGKLGLGTKAAQGLSLAAMSVGAGGKGVEEALDEGANIHQASLYGILTGVTEAGTEMIGGIGTDFASGIIGKAALKNAAIKKFTSSIAGKMVAGFLSEGFEEVLSDVVNPIWKKISFDYEMDLGKEYASGEFWGGVAQSFVVGGLLGAMGTGVQYYKIGKSKINGKKIGQKAAIQYSEFTNTKSDFDLNVKKTFSEFADIVNTNDIDINDGTTIDKAFNQVLEDENVSEKQKEKLKKRIEKVKSLSSKYIESQNALIKSFESQGITAEDMVAEYEIQKDNDIKKMAKEEKLETITESFSDNVKGVGVESIIQDGTVVLDSEITSPELEMKTSSMVIDNTELVEKTTTIATEEQTAKIEAVANEMNVAEENKPKFVQENVAKEVVKEVAKESNADLADDVHKEIVEEAIKESDSIEEAIAYARQNIEVQSAKTSDRHNVGGKEIADIKMPKHSAGFDSFCNKFLDDAFAVKSYLKRTGMSETEVNDFIRKVRANSGVAKNVVENGFFEVVKDENGKYKIERSTKGLYNGKDGIIDMMQQYAVSKSMSFDDINALVQEGLSLLDESDRVKEGKTVFGVFYSLNSMSDAELVNLQKTSPEMYQRILNGENISEAEFDSLIKDGNEYTGSYLTSEEIDARLAEIRKEVTNFDELQNELYKINNKILDLRVQAGMITLEQAQEWRNTKPHYVPEFRVLVGRESTGVNAVRLQGTGLAKAKGSNLAIQDIFLSVESQVKKVHKFKAMNDLILKLMDSGNTDSIQLVKELPYVTDINEDIVVDRVQIQGETVYAYRNGTQYELRVSPEIAESLHSMDGSLRSIGQNSVILKAVRNAASVVRKLMTSYNPFFSWFRNPIKDLQSAVIYSKNGTATLLKNWGRSLTQVVSHSELFQIYETLSGQSVTLQDSYNAEGEKSFYNDLKSKDVSKKIRSIMRNLSNANEIMEHTTRFAEFLSSFERLQKEGVSYNKAIDIALVDAQEITLNFSRQGNITKVLNRYVPFLTANIEAAARNVRVLISPKSAREWATLILKLLIMGVLPQVIQELIYADDEDYQMLSDSFKSNYYLIKVGDQFVRIPKGYIQQAFASDVVLATKGVNGEEIDWEDIKQMMESNWNAVGLDISGVFFQPIIDANNNKTWYGGQIVGQEWQNTRPSNQYDENTSEISKFLGKIFNYSPLKIEYILDQMTGIIGDIVLPLTTKGNGNTLKKIASVVSSQFITDPVYKNKLASEFYDYKEEMTFNKTDGDVVSSIVVSYLTRCSNEISDLNKLVEELNANTNISDDEKSSKGKIYQGMKNLAYKQALENAKKLEKELANYELSEESIEEDKREAIRQALGAETALKICTNKRVYSKAQCYFKAGISYDNFYVYYFNMKALPDREAVENYIVRLRVSPQIKNLLYALMGYNIGKDKKNVLTAWLKRKGLTAEEIDLIL